MTPEPQIQTAATQTNGFQISFKDAINLEDRVLGDNVLVSAVTGEMTFIPTSTAGIVSVFFN